MKIKDIIKVLQAHEDQERELEIEITVDNGLANNSHYYQAVEVSPQLDGDIYLTTAEIKLTN